MYLRGAIFLIATISLANSRIWKGTLAVTTEEFYKDAYFQFSSNEIIAEHVVPNDWLHAPIQYCNLECMLQYGKCKAFRYDENDKTCYISNVNTCSERKKLYQPVAGVVQYDVRDGTEESTTCQSECYDTNQNDTFVCEKCGYMENCLGPRCGKPCVPFCWQLEPRVNREVFMNGLFTGYVKRVLCENEWHCIFKEPETGLYTLYLHQYSKYFKGLQLKLKIRLEYDNNGEITYRQSIFKDASFTSSTLSVGEFVEGDAGNFWNASFVNRGFLQPSNPLLYPFFYRADVGNSSTSFTSPHYFWPIGDSKVDAIRITNIMLWVTENDVNVPQQEDVNDYYGVVGNIS